MKEKDLLVVEPTSSSSSGARGNMFQCFAPSFGRKIATGTWFTQWREEFTFPPLMMKTKHEEALARLVPALLCGEQSAIEVFQSEAEQLTHQARNVSSTLFHIITNDEAVHEASLQLLRAKLPVSDDENAIKRRSQAFFARLGQAKTTAHRFAQIAQLDSAVCVIMWYVQNSELGCNKMIGALAERIKFDEARHVAISRRHALNLGLTGDDYSQVGELVHDELTMMLECVADSFDVIGIDADMLFARIKRGVP